MTADSPDLDRLDTLAVEAIRDGNTVAPTIRALISELRQTRAARDSALETGGALAIILLEVIGQRDAALAKVAAVRLSIEHAPFWGVVHVDVLRAALNVTDTPTASATDQES